LGGNIITEDIKEGCSIVKKNAEELKVKFGSALAVENKEEEIVTIPGLPGRPPKEISMKNLASIIQARMEEIVEYIYFEIKNSGYEKKLYGGIVLTGGGALLKHLAQLVEFKTGMDTRIGYPNEHLANDVPADIASPMYSTGIGLVIVGIDRYEKEKEKLRQKQAMIEQEEFAGVEDSVKLPRKPTPHSKFFEKVSQTAKNVFSGLSSSTVENFFNEKDEEMK
jgi:cell division protein FtsA